MEAIHRLLSRLNRLLTGFSMLALIAAAGVLTLSVLLRYFLKVPTDWQDETAVFLLVGVTFLTGASVQAARGHVAIELLSEFLAPGAEKWRRRLGDVVSFLFCGFFAWKSWVLLQEAIVEGETTSSTWGPPLWIPYSMMAFGMTLLAVQLLLQVVTPDKAR